MGMLVPAELPLASLKNDEERLVVRTLCDRLTDGWLVLPSVGLSGDDRDREIDVVIAHPRDGVAVVEVKGHRPVVRDGIWYAHGSAMSPQPLSQARDNAYELRRRIRALHPNFGSVRVEYAVAFPNTADLDGRLPPDVDRTQVLTLTDLEDCQERVDRLVFRRGGPPLGELGLQKLVDLLRPNCEFRYEPEALALHARQRLDDICALQVQALETLDANRRVCVTGAAGTGKTRLAAGWAHRALTRGERVLLTCFNIPLAESLRDRLGDSEQLRIGAFHEVALELDGMPPLDIPDTASREWWDTVEIGHLHVHWHQVTERFDTIIVDEAQDFRPAWIDLLERLLDRDGPRRIMVLADLSQEVYTRGFQVPRHDDGWTLCELTNNCRNTFQIATLLRGRFDAAIAPVGGPESEDVRWIEADDLDAISDAVGVALDHLEDRDHAASTMLVATMRTSVRDRLRADYGFDSWERTDPMTIVCENVHRIKGLEYDHVILVAYDPDGEVTDELLYVGASRAVMSLTVIGPASVGERLDIADRL
jgi:hypothetical protein